ncbi:tudor domain-containing protein 1 isoform X2 [Corythoichthys intestinalis]|uniref:tudor domain-containing protein 1 isoform X2 n=1 Tax=Corythoichthys intestinalis TaxID=161448 RepID=UPI0025A5D09A|nr:tudor domain-containing protein 1 isoform X2 [Corythoichthys intestinalis]
MSNPLLPNVVRPNLPLRQPSSMCPSLPGRVAAAASPVRPDLLSVATDVASPQMNPPTGLGPMPTPVCLCRFCGQGGSFRCTRCKKTMYCSALCQSKDWKCHRLICVPADPEPAKENLNLTASLPALANNDNLKKPASAQKVFLKDLEKMKINEGTEFQACVSEIHNPGRFFLFLQNSELLENLHNIRGKLQKAASGSPAQPYAPCVGEVCAVQFSADQVWYRGFIQKLAADKKEAHVLYIDYGNEENVSVDRMRALPVDLDLFYPCAMECQVAGVDPPEGGWLPECLSVLKELLAGKFVMAKLTEMAANGPPYAVDIQLPTGKLLSTYLLDSGFGTKVVASPIMQDIQAILNASLENFKRQSEGKDDNSWAQPPEPLTQSVGDSFSVVVMSFQSPDSIIVQKVDNAGIIQKLQLQLRQHCNQLSVPQNFRPAPGTACCALFTEDKQWYRAKVLAYSSEERVCVSYFDFGNSEDLDIACLKPISSELLVLPMQAIPCALAGIQPVGESWSTECLLALQHRLSNRILRLAIEGAQEGSTLVALVDEASDPQADMAELLVSAGYAVPVKPDPVPPAALQPPDDPGFPLDWKTTALPTDEPFKPCIAAIASPSLFFVLSPRQEVEQKLPVTMQELAAFCGQNRGVLSSFVDCGKLLPGAACCAQFTADDNWYRAVVVKAGDDDGVTVIYADYGNSETLPISRILPIPAHLLQLPFQIVRCALTGKDHFPAEWPPEALQVFLNYLQDDFLATTLSFDGFVNILAISRPPEMRGAQVSALILDALQTSRVEAVPSLSNAVEERNDAPETPLTPDLETTAGDTEMTPQSPQQTEITGAEPQKSAACCCAILIAKIERLEEQMEALRVCVERFHT